MPTQEVDRSPRGSEKEVLCLPLIGTFLDKLYEDTYNSFCVHGFSWSWSDGMDDAHSMLFRLAAVLPYSPHGFWQALLFGP